MKHYKNDHICELDTVHTKNMHNNKFQVRLGHTFDMQKYLVFHALSCDFIFECSDSVLMS